MEKERGKETKKALLLAKKSKSVNINSKYNQKCYSHDKGEVWQGLEF